MKNENTEEIAAIQSPIHHVMPDYMMRALIASKEDTKVSEIMKETKETAQLMLRSIGSITQGKPVSVILMALDAASSAVSNKVLEQMLADGATNKESVRNFYHSAFIVGSIITGLVSTQFSPESLVNDELLYKAADEGFEDGSADASVESQLNFIRHALMAGIISSGNDYEGMVKALDSFTETSKPKNDGQADA